MIVSISADDPRVDDYRAIPDPERLRTRGRFVAEGRIVVERLLRSARVRPQSLLVTPGALEALGRRVDLAAASFPVFVADADTISTIGGFNFHRGCLAIGERPAAPSLDTLLDTLPETGIGANHRAPLIVLEGLTQADNVGSIFRNAQAFAAAAVLLDETCCDPLYRKAVRTSMGAVLDVPFTRLADAPAAVQRLRDRGYRVLALTPASDATPIVDVSTTIDERPVALLVGGEGPGLSTTLLALADVRVRIPMAPGVDSLNVATATGIALHRIGQ